jgi:glyoxalase family protein
VTGTTNIEPWTDGPVPVENAIRGFHSVTLESLNPEQTGRVLDTLGYEPAERNDDRTRYRASGDRERSDAPQGRQGVGTVHHVAFRAPDEETQLEWREQLADSGLRVTSQKDRQYFKSIYFRELGGVLFEIATDGPGFIRDESEVNLGMELKLPPWLESERETLEERLPEISASGTGVN